MSLIKRFLAREKSPHEGGGVSAADGPTVALVGHCGPDSFALAQFVRREAPGALVKSISKQRDLDEALETLDALLVNRVLDGRFGNRDGVALIRALRDRTNTNAPIAILVSNFANAQSNAEAAGAAPGFGKDDLRASAAADRLRSAIARARATRKANEPNSESQSA